MEKLTKISEADVDKLGRLIFKKSSDPSKVFSHFIHIL
jgi:hypothetical protein